MVLKPCTLGLDWAIGKKKVFSFLGQRALTRSDTVRENRKQLVGLQTEDPDIVIPEGAQIVFDPQQSIPMDMQGHVTSSYYSACLNKSIALAVVKGGHGRIGENVYCPLADGRVIKAQVVNSVFYDPEGERHND